MIISDISQRSEFKAELFDSLFSFLEIIHVTETFWYLQFLTNTSFQVENSSFQTTLAKTRRLQTNLFNFFLIRSAYQRGVSMLPVIVQLWNATIDWTAAHWQTLKHICMLTSSSALLPLLKDQQKQKKMQHVLNIDKPELYPGRDR